MLPDFPICISVPLNAWHVDILIHDKMISLVVKLNQLIKTVS